MRVMRIAAAEGAFLRSAEFLPQDLRQTLIDQLSRESRSGVARLVLEEEDAERLRDVLTEQLGRVGFDRDYALTSQGDMLERLIDGFAP